ncbi:hypothetical protein [Olivibacter sitiensis]|uniref:hypothetical protein n=1 Tax=Olivibacter sitiensis TaxID=376470 RepID=UPI0006882BE3|nr:hypothetical protein [Olivibacter sitiensis]
MEENKDKTKTSKFQGIGSLLYFNWPNYLMVLTLVILLGILEYLMPSEGFSIYRLALMLLLLSIFSSLLVSFYIQDLSPLYNLRWMKLLPKIPRQAKIVLIHAGMDNISATLNSRYADAQLLKYNIYDYKRHTKEEGRKIRKKHPLTTDTIAISTSFLPIAPRSADAIFFILSAGELKDKYERIGFFKQMQESLKPEGQLIFVEHTKNVANLLAFTWGATDLLKNKEWESIFVDTKLNAVYYSGTITPFLSIYSLGTNN